MKVSLGTTLPVTALPELDGQCFSGNFRFVGAMNFARMRIETFP